MSVIERLAEKTLCLPSGCWEWQGYITSNGYGHVSIDSKRNYVHRWSYEIFVGPIPKDFTVDHLCRNRKCCNPDHLEAVTAAENIERGLTGWNNFSKMECKRGHLYTPENTIWSVQENGRRARWCKKCRSAYDRARRPRKIRS